MAQPRYYKNIHYYKIYYYLCYHVTYMNSVFHLSLSESVHSFFMPGSISHWSDKLNSTSSNFNVSSPIRGGRIACSNELLSDTHVESPYDVSCLSSPFLTYLYSFLQIPSSDYKGPACYDAYTDWYIWKYNKYPYTFPTSFEVSSAILLSLETSLLIICLAIDYVSTMGDL